MEVAEPDSGMGRRTAANLREVKLALRESMLAHLQEARSAKQLGATLRMESAAIKRALVASAVDDLLKGRRARWANTPYVKAPDHAPPDMSATGAERRLLHASSRLKRHCRDASVGRLADEISRLAGTSAKERV